MINRRDAIAALSAGAGPSMPAAAAARTSDGPEQRAASTILWYARPAASWVETLLVGNGGINAMVHGGTDHVISS